MKTTFLNIHGLVQLGTVIKETWFCTTWPWSRDSQLVGVERMRLLNSLDPKWNIYIISFPKTQRSSQKRVAKKGRKDRKSQRKQRSAVGKGSLMMTRTLDTWIHRGCECRLSHARIKPTQISVLMEEGLMDLHSWVRSCWQLVTGGGENWQTLDSDSGRRPTFQWVSVDPCTHWLC